MSGRSPTAGYRPHLDGIRAVAVVLVVLFHLGITWVPGGFVGVDVFFVLSGYLITGLLLREAASTGTVGLGRFYARRVRRLLPASVAVLAAVLVAGARLFDVVQQDGLRGDVLFSALYSANWRFATAGGDYFAPGDVPSPLVHYWSLAVEEQFYVVWPVLFLGLWRLATRRRPAGPDEPAGVEPSLLLLGAVGALGLASAVASVVLAGSPLAYYGTHTRAYQLLAGAALAVAARRWGWRLPATPAGRRLSLAGTAGALAALAALAHRIPDAADYPGWSGVAVTAASLALIGALDLAPAGRATALVGHRSLAAVGRLSYSLYIWHWPVIVVLPVLAERSEGARPWLDDRPVLVAAMTGLALASYLLVERPVRFRLRMGARPVAVVAVGLACSVLVAALAQPVLAPAGPYAERVLAAVRDLARPGICPYFPDEWGDPGDDEPCVYRMGTPGGPVVAVVGDSHAQQWQPALEVLAEASGATLVRVTRGGCPANHVAAYARNEAGRNQVDEDCLAWRQRVYPRLVERHDPDVILVATRSHVRGIRHDGRDVGPRDPDHRQVWADGWDWTLATLSAGSGLVVVSEIIPTLPRRVPACLLEQSEGTTRCDFPVERDQVVGPYNDVIRRLPEGAPGVRVVDPTPIACPDRTCTAVLDGIVVHRDDNHLSATYVRHRAAALGELLAAVGAHV